MYRGMIVPVHLGDGGLLTDQNQSRTPITNVIRAENIRLKYGYIEKDFGSRRWSKTSLNSAILGLIEYYPDPILQRVIAATADGKIYKFTTGYLSSEVTSETTPTLKTQRQVHLIAGGFEQTGNPKKLFIFTGSDPVQQISGDASTRSDIPNPAADWSGTNQPSFAIIHRSFMWAFGNQNYPHNIYRSLITDHSNFKTTPSVNTVFPNEGERLISAIVFRGKLFLFKYPRGVYILVDDDVDPTNWYFSKVTDSFGAVSAHSAIEVMDDFLVANATGGVSTFSITNALGGVETEDAFNILGILRFVQENLVPGGTLDRCTLYHDLKKLCYLTYRSKSGSTVDRMIVLDYRSTPPLVTIDTKYQANCLALKRDLLGSQRPIYGADDGYIYEMGDSDVFTDRNINGSGYVSGFQTPHMDFGAIDISPLFGQSIADKNKIFDFLEVVFQPAGNWNVNVDVYIDNNYSETLSFKMSSGGEMGNTTTTMDTARMASLGNRSYLKPIHGQGRRISFYVYNNNANQYFKLSTLKVYFRLSATQQKGT